MDTLEAKLISIEKSFSLEIIHSLFTFTHSFTLSVCLFKARKIDNYRFQSLISVSKRALTLKAYLSTFFHSIQPNWVYFY